MADGNIFGLNQINALLTAAQGHDENALQLREDVQKLITDLESDVGAMAGNQLGQFRTAKNAFFMAFNALAEKAGLQGVDLGDIHTMGGRTDLDTEADFQQVGASVPQINAKL